ncbi:hypothetical protein D1818_14355 [Aquimarina sp. BL5]|uniref:TDP-N-acetylfucosamine:lipid II N-acetylfucosaminyltransferase n=2 Tax=Aquimarina sp. BL5 TaxID=1714860 RepID=UPI000E51F44B|nr:TDP-N-acetylfucosamine:lipid II N-acetylfucosaminyltransferase [Aquimarina sp. BL5]AXT51969.1 hypothetical protein D1818_14355 [Aquimarina sp. BL5]
MKTEYKILHIAPDEKFIKSANWQFEKVFPGQNSFIIFLGDRAKESNYVEPSENVEIVKLWQLNFSNFILKVKKYDLVVMHGLNFFQSKVIVNLGNSIKFLWLFWGGEIYDNPKAFKDLVIGKESQKKFLKVSFKDRIKNNFRPIYYSIFKNSILPENLILKAAKKVDNIGILHKEDFDFLKKSNVIHKNTNHIKMTYYPLEFIFKENKDILVKGEHILLGNSASITNNHIESFEYLSKLDITDHKIIAPLNYGNKEYGKKIANLGKAQFKDNFEALLDFMPLEDYNKLVRKCGFVIMNHYRQQAVGNILAMLWMGAKVFLDEQNSFYNYLKRIGIHVFSIPKDLIPENKTVFNKLTPDEVSTNRMILSNEIGIETLQKELKEQINTILT